MSEVAIPKREVSFRWKKGLGDQEVISVIYAIYYGHETKEALIKALPMFSFKRLLIALEKLISSGLVSVSSQYLILKPEAMLLDQLTTKSIKLPISGDVEDLTAEDYKYLFYKLGVNNIALAMKFIWVNLK